MRKTGKRIFSVILLIVTVLLIGCLVYTGNRLANYPRVIDEYKRAIFDGKDGTMVAFTEDKVWYGKVGEEVVLLEIISYEEGVITMRRTELVYRFLVIDDKTIYDESSRKILTRRVGGG